MARDGEINLSYVPTAEMLADCFTKPLLKPTFLKQSPAMRMIGTCLGNGVAMGTRNGVGNGLGTHGYGRGNGIGTGQVIRNAVGK
jgi:hypothetical protein